MKKEKEKIAYLAEHTTRSDLWDIKEMLNAVLRDLRDGKTDAGNPKQAVLVLLDNEEREYAFTSYTAKMTSSEIIALLEVVKQLFIKDLV